MSHNSGFFPFGECIHPSCNITMAFLIWLLIPCALIIGSIYRWSLSYGLFVLPCKIVYTDLYIYILSPRSNRALINVWIPSVFLRGKAANAFHVYQVSVLFSEGILDDSHYPSVRPAPNLLPGKEPALTPWVLKKRYVY